MTKKFLISLFLIFFIHNYSFSAEKDCSDFKRFSVEYMKCKASSIKDKTFSVGKNFVKDTKEFQTKEWNDEKEKVDKIKKKVLD